LGFVVLGWVVGFGLWVGFFLFGGVGVLLVCFCLVVLSQQLVFAVMSSEKDLCTA
jgi:hypothetical protein